MLHCEELEVPEVRIDRWLRLVPTESVWKHLLGLHLDLGFLDLTEARRHQRWVLLRLAPSGLT